MEVAQKLAAFRPFRAVYGNIDGQEIRRMFPQVNRFTGGRCRSSDEAHRGGIREIMIRPSREVYWCIHPSCFISGHSHILKVKYDKTLDMLHINPGAAGMSGFHKVRTMVRFAIDNGVFKDLEVIELAG